MKRKEKKRNQKRGRGTKEGVKMVDEKVIKIIKRESDGRKESY